MKDFITARSNGNTEECCRIQKAINRDSWRLVLTTVKARDLRQVFQYSAKADGRKPMSYCPSCVDPLWDEKENCWCFKPKDKANLLERAFEDKMTQYRKGKRAPRQKIYLEIRSRFPEGRMELEPRISEQEVRAAIKDLPRKKAAGPDMVPNEAYRNCPAVVASITELLNSMIQQGEYRTK